MITPDINVAQDAYIGYCYILVLLVYVFTYFITRDRKEKPENKVDKSIYN